MNIQTNQLEREGFQELAVLPHNSLAPFIQPYFKRKNRFVWIYIVLNFGFILASGLAFGYHIGKTGDFAGAFFQLSMGLLTAFLLLPIHEGLHALAYRIVGAQRISFGADLKHLVFYALADRFVTSRREFFFVALLPVSVLTPIFLIAMILMPDYQLLFLSAGLWHSAMCGGDFGLASFFEEHRHLEVITYDEVDEKRSFFLARPLKAESEAHRAIDPAGQPDAA